MFRFCNCDGIKASRKLSKSCRVNVGGGLGCDGVAAAFAGGGVGSEINGEDDGAGPCANAAAVAVKTNNAITFCTAANLPVVWPMTRLRLNYQRRSNAFDPLLQFFEMRTGPVNLPATGAITKLLIINLRQWLEPVDDCAFVDGLEQFVTTEAAAKR